MRSDRERVPAHGRVEIRRSRAERQIFARPSNAFAASLNDSGPTRTGARNGDVVAANDRGVAVPRDMD